MDKVGLSHSTYKMINGVKVKDSFSAIKNKANLPPTHPDYKLDLSTKSKELNKDIQNTKDISKPTKTVDETSSDIKLERPELPSTPDLPDLSDAIEVSDKVEKAEKVAKIVEPKSEEKLKTPAVFFVGGFELFDMSFMDDGMKSMTDAIKEARYYSWDQKNEMIDEIKNRENDQRVILVGQGFGGDTAVEIAQELNTVENGFRTIDLLVTLNSVGLDNDFIPQNVSKNLNFLTANNGWFDDGPNIAINYKRTQVENYLRPESHSDLDNTTDVQIEIINAINSLV